MNRNNTQSLIYGYCLDRLNLREIKIKNEYDSQLDALGLASGEWDQEGKLIGNLKVKIRSIKNLKKTLDTIAHELVHIRQYVDGTAYFKGNNRLYGGIPDHYNYADRNIEREARKKAEILTTNFIEKHWEDMSFWCKLNILYFNIINK